jgi:hypothetical protein
VRQALDNYTGATEWTVGVYFQASNLNGTAAAPTKLIEIGDNTNFQPKNGIYLVGDQVKFVVSGKTRFLAKQIKTNTRYFAFISSPSGHVLQKSVCGIGGEYGLDYSENDKIEKFAEGSHYQIEANDQFMISLISPGETGYTQFSGTIYVGFFRPVGLHQENGNFFRLRI